MSPGFRVGKLVKEISQLVVGGELRCVVYTVRVKK